MFGDLCANSLGRSENIVICEDLDITASFVVATHIE